MEVLIVVCLWGLLVGLVLRVLAVKSRRNKVSPCMYQWPPEVVERLKREAEGRSISAFNKIRNERRLKVAEIAKDLEANPFDFKFQPNVITQEEFKKMFPHPRAGYGRIAFEEACLVPVKVHPILENAIMMSELRETAGRIQTSINHHRLYGGQYNSQYREELNLKLLAFLFRMAQDGNSPYVIGRVS